jgi:hypothetical protein
MIPILLALALIAVLFVVIIAGRPDEFIVLRSIKIAAPPEKVFPHVNNLHKWEAWSPWAKLDPDAKNSFAGADFGTGATMSWSGNKKIGEGRMTITQSKEYESIRFKLEFIRPFKATNTAEFSFRPEGTQTVVTWTMTGKNNFFFKVFGLFMNCDDMVGKDFDKGLAAMKSVAEAAD